MDFLQSKSGTVQQNMGLIKKCVEDLLAGLQSKEKELEAVQESVAQSSKELDLKKESIEEWVKQVTKKEEELKEIQLGQENERSELELKKKEMGLILEYIKVREGKLEGQEKLVAETFEEIKLEKGKLESIQKSIRHVDEKTEKYELEIEQKEKILASREVMVLAKEKEFDARKKMLNRKCTGESGPPNADSAEPRKIRKRRRIDTDTEIIDLEKLTVEISDASELDLSSENSYSRANSSSGTADYKFPETEFNDFEKLRNGFDVNQLWAIYDKVDRMPRKYAQIMKVVDQGLCIAWLKVDSRYSYEISSPGFPVACGKFERGNLVANTDKLIFSHQIPCEKYGWSAGCYLIYPRKGEIWALFKDWNTGSSSKSASCKKYNYEIVEVLSDFVENRGVRVVYLDKIRGYVSLFQRAVQNSIFRIPAREMFRFSHKVPSYRMNGTEGEGVPKGSFELDTAALPMVLCDKGGEK